MSDASRQNSPKSSPRGSRSPAYPRQDTTGTLKTTIALGKNPAVITTGPFYLMKDKPEQCEPTGSTNLMSFYNLEHSYNKFSGKKLKEELSTFLPNLPGNIDTPGIQDNSSLRSIIEKPPITGKELIPLSGSQFTGFRLHPGPLPEQYRVFSQAAPQRRKKHKKHKKESKESTPENLGTTWFNHEHNEVEVMSEADAKRRKEKVVKEENKVGKKDKKKKKKKKEKDKDVLLST